MLLRKVVGHIQQPLLSYDTNHYFAKLKIRKRGALDGKRKN